MRIEVMAVGLFSVGCFPGPLELERDSMDQGDTISLEVSGPEVSQSPDTDTSGATLDVETTTEEVVDDTGSSVDGTSLTENEILDLEVSTCETTSSDELCNGLDDNCDGSTDEGFTDTNVDSVADCVDDDDDGDGIPDLDDDEPLVPWVDPCANPAQLGPTTGCAFWTADLPIVDGPDADPAPSSVPHALVITNPSTHRVTVTLTYGTDVPGSPPTTASVDPGASLTIELPGSASADGVVDTGVLVTTDRPVSLLQVDPWEQASTTDATTLLPVHALGTEHVVVSWPTVDNMTSLTGYPNHYGWVAIVATADRTVVEVATTAQLENPEVLGATGLAYLDRGQVLVLRGRGLGNPATPGADLTGALVSANEPIAVFAGHDFAPFYWVDSDTCCGGRLTTQVLPAELSGTRFVARPPAGPKLDAKHLWRVVSLDEDVFVRSNVYGLDQRLLEKRGDWIQWYGPGGVLLSSTGRVGLYLIVPGQLPPEPIEFNGLSDPALLGILPLEAWRTTHHVTALADYTSHVTIVRLTNSDVAIDGDLVAQSDFKNMPAPPGNFLPGNDSYQYAHIELSPGRHTLVGTTPIGVTLLGYATRSTYGTFVGGTGARWPISASP